MAITTGKQTRKQSGGNRRTLKSKHRGRYVERPGIHGGRTRAQKIAARDTAATAM